MTMTRNWLVVGCLLAGLGVAAGAFGSHALNAGLTPERMAVFETAVRYQVVHALALLFIGLASARYGGRLWDLAGWLFTVGTVVFAGSLYILVLADQSWLGAVTPLGGACFLAGWVAAGLAVSVRGVAE